MEIAIETQGRYGPDEGEAAGKPYGLARFVTGDGWTAEALIGRSVHHPNVYLFDCRVAYGARTERAWTAHVELDFPFDQAAAFILGVMLQAVAQRRREVFGEPLPLAAGTASLPA